VDIGDGVGAAGGGRVAGGGVDGGIAGAARPRPGLELLARVFYPSQASRVVCAPLGGVWGGGLGRGQEVAFGSVGRRRRSGQAIVILRQSG
jgi:hypothetical protein